MDERLFDLRLMSQLQKTFVSKENVDFTQPNVVAALATAASKVAFASGEFDEGLVCEQILDLYQKLDDENTKAMVGMGPQYVGDAIGYDVDFNDYGAITGEYLNNKDNYDKTFNSLNSRAELLQARTR